MAEPDAKGVTASGASAGRPKAPKPQNPVFRMMGARHRNYLLAQLLTVLRSAQHSNEAPLS